MQFQANVLGVPVEVARERETTALGAAALALGRPPEPEPGARYEPEHDAEHLYAGWRNALAAVL
jgi:glycerol kinase